MAIPSPHNIHTGISRTAPPPQPRPPSGISATVSMTSSPALSSLPTSSISFGSPLSSALDKAYSNNVAHYTTAPRRGDNRPLPVPLVCRGSEDPATSSSRSNRDRDGNRDSGIVLPRAAPLILNGSTHRDHHPHRVGSDGAIAPSLIIPSTRADSDSAARMPTGHASLDKLSASTDASCSSGSSSNDHSACGSLGCSAEVLPHQQQQQAVNERKRELEDEEVEKEEEEELEAESGDQVGNLRSRSSLEAGGSGSGSERKPGSMKHVKGNSKDSSRRASSSSSSSSSRSPAKPNESSPSSSIATGNSFGAAGSSGVRSEGTILCGTGEAAGTGGIESSPTGSPRGIGGPRRLRSSSSTHSSSVGSVTGILGQSPSSAASSASPGVGVVAGGKPRRKFAPSIPQRRVSAPLELLTNGGGAAGGNGVGFGASGSNGTALNGSSHGVVPVASAQSILHAVAAFRESQQQLQQQRESYMPSGNSAAAATTTGLGISGSGASPVIPPSYASAARSTKAGPGAGESNMTPIAARFASSAWRDTGGTLPSVSTAISVPATDSTGSIYSTASATLSASHSLAFGHGLSNGKLPSAPSNSAAIPATAALVRAGEEADAARARNRSEPKPPTASSKSKGKGKAGGSSEGSAHHKALLRGSTGTSESLHSSEHEEQQIMSLSDLIDFSGAAEPLNNDDQRKDPYALLAREGSVEYLRDLDPAHQAHVASVGDAPAGVGGTGAAKAGVGGGVVNASRRASNSSMRTVSDYGDEEAQLMTATKVERSSAITSPVIPSLLRKSNIVHGKRATRHSSSQHAGNKDGVESSPSASSPGSITPSTSAQSFATASPGFDSPATGTVANAAGTPAVPSSPDSGRFGLSRGFSGARTPTTSCGKQRKSPPVPLRLRDANTDAFQHSASNQVSSAAAALTERLRSPVASPTATSSPMQPLPLTGPPSEPLPPVPSTPSSTHMAAGLLCKNSAGAVVEKEAANSPRVVIQPETPPSSGANSAIALPERSSNLKLAGPYLSGNATTSSASVPTSVPRSRSATVPAPTPAAVTAPTPTNFATSTPSAPAFASTRLQGQTSLSSATGIEVLRLPSPSEQGRSSGRTRTRSNGSLEMGGVRVLMLPSPRQSSRPSSSPLVTKATALSTSSSPSSFAGDAGKSPRGFPRSVGDEVDAAGAAPESSDSGYGLRARTNSQVSNFSMLTRRESVPVTSRRAEMEEDRVSANRSDVLKRAESRFTGAFGEIADAFKVMVAEKKMLEQFVKSSELGGSHSGGHGEENAVEPMRRQVASLTAKLETSSVEIKQLLELLDQQSATITLMAETHQKELRLGAEEVDELGNELEQVSQEAKIHRANAIKLTQQLEEALTEGVSLRAECLKHKTESSERLQQLQQLRSAHERLQKDLTQARAIQTEAIGVHEGKAKELQAKIEQADSDRSALEAARIELMKQIDGAQSESGKQAQKAAAAEAELKRVTLRLQEELQSVRDGYEARMSDTTALYSSEVADLQAALQAAGGETGQHVAIQNRLHSLVSEHQVALASHRAQADKVRSELRAAHARELEALESRALAHKAEADASYSKVKMLADESAVRDLQIETLQTQLARMVEELAAKDNELVAAKLRGNALQEELLQRPKSAGGNSTHSIPESFVDDQKTELSDLQKAQSAHQLIQANSQRVFDSQQMEIKKLQTEIQTLRSEHLLALGAVDKARARADHAEQEQSSLKEELAEMQAKLASFMSSTKMPEDGHESADSLRSQLADQRARETTILTAYKQLRDELRKMQAVQSKEKRSGFLVRPGTSSAQEDGSSKSPRQLKRLSLPVQDLGSIPRMFADSAGTPNRPKSATSHPPPSMRHLSLTSSQVDSIRAACERGPDDDESEIVLSPQVATHHERESTDACSFRQQMVP
ncbi:hypothetical protein K437DRAFT_276854 [Tilletiaria anomala UBC 951]|uniref:Uncharacterized protein n=1 Tax=Tilletiaria anomala (strain ATCC 24038 / CBS 436.72 / UBC 951) TaxID=1037660 RepID=A0A066V3B1_TILAU|nr:uncharacterized protein K437DRAFT_276854 [Tilletiaria anomala UBC 951]KDN36202.1 hypothetical protein K437DRAFT_276854 [Tilletiaria anomala UBC 951]